jgi:hypothetical protein
MTVPMFLDGALDRAAFLAYVEQMRACEPACCLHADRCGKSLIQWMSRGGQGSRPFHSQVQQADVLLRGGADRLWSPPAD